MNSKKIEQEEKLEQLRLKSELAQTQAKLNVCILTEREHVINSQADQDLKSVSYVDKEQDMERFLSSASKPAVGDGLVGDQTKLGVSDSSAVSHTSFHHVGPISLAQPDLTP